MSNGLMKRTKHMILWQLVTTFHKGKRASLLVHILQINNCRK